MSKTEESALGFISGPLNETESSFTLTTMLGEFLFEIEQAYGSRDKSFTPLGIEFFGHIPQIWFPRNREYVAIRLSLDAAGNYEKAVFQLAHEAVHLLAPCGASNVAEEGLATVFCNGVGLRRRSGQKTFESAYLQAEAVIKEWLSVEPDGVTKTRRSEPAFHKWTPDIIVSAAPSTPLALAEQLCAPFDRDAT